MGALLAICVLYWYLTPDHPYRTALHWAAKRGHTKTIQVLLANGGDLKVTNNGGQTPVDVAEPSCAAVLKAAGVAIAPVEATIAVSEDTSFTPSYRANPKTFYPKTSQPSTSVPMATQPTAVVNNKLLASTEPSPTRPCPVPATPALETPATAVTQAAATPVAAPLPAVLRSVQVYKPNGSCIEVVCVPANLTVRQCMEGVDVPALQPTLSVKIEGLHGLKRVGVVHPSTQLSQVVEGLRLYHGHDGLDLVLSAAGLTEID